MLIVRDSVNKKAVENRPEPSEGIKKESHALFSSRWVFLEGERMLVLPDRGPALCDHASVRLGGPGGVFKPMKERFQSETERGWWSTVLFHHLGQNWNLFHGLFSFSK